MTRWEVIPMISREEALELLKKYNKEEFHVHHGITPVSYTHLGH